MGSVLFGKHEAEIYSSRGLQLDFKELMTDIRKLPVVLVTAIPKRSASRAMQSRSAVSVL